MTYDARHRDLRDRIGKALHRRDLTAWQRKFLTDMNAKIARYGARTQFTEKQMDALSRVLGKPATEVSSRRSAPARSTSTVRPFRRQRRRRGPVPWMVRRFAPMLLVLAVVGVIAALQGPSVPIVASQHLSASQPAAAPVWNMHVIDGDTIRLPGESRSYRLVGFNTPETQSAQCPAERQLGNQATARLRELVDAGTPTLQRVACACRPGTEGTDRCNFGRLCGRLSVDGRDVGAILISEGLAVPFHCGATSCPRTPRPWC
jgi:micrococcal nuclease